MNYQTDTTTTTQTSEPEFDSIRAEISREMVRLYKELFGRGPTKARTEFAGPDLVICSLENTFTPAERSLAEMGEHQRLRDTRMYFQAATSDKFREIIERLTGRKVRAFISGLDADADVCSEVFYLENGHRGEG
ncbi:MAG TPA: Na-translocating system protein MpsC family protein [Solirubrobacterales bacterium]|nr:Na-translocating system protein MpsC family protein [Solirubrobacterales bacterium]